MDTYFVLFLSKMSYKKKAVVLLAFNRPEYLSRVLPSLEDNTEINRYDWYLFQDGITNELSGISYSEEEAHSKVTEQLYRAKLPNKTVITRPYNIAPSQQRYHALKLLEEYDLLFCFDDDMIVSKYYLKLLRIMAEQFPNYIGILYSNKPNKQRINVVSVERTARLWGHYINKETYGKIKDDYQEYYEAISKVDFHQIITLKARQEGLVPNNLPHVMDDKAINRICLDKGIKKLVPEVSRGYYIGKKGLIAYKTSDLWRKRRMDFQKEQINYEVDRTRKEFILA